MSETTPERRDAWQNYQCNRDAMVVVGFGPDRIRVAPETPEAWRALETVFQAHRYDIRVPDTDSYCCRQIKGGGGKSLHCFGIALDVNWKTNPFKYTPDNRAVRFSSKQTQTERSQEVKLELADTDMTPDLIADIRAIKTKRGQGVFKWGGDWHDRKDLMHFELDVTPLELQDGIDWATVKTPSVDVMADDDDRRGMHADIDLGAALAATGRGALPTPRTALLQRPASTPSLASSSAMPSRYIKPLRACPPLEFWLKPRFALSWTRWNPSRRAE